MTQVRKIGFVGITLLSLLVFSMASTVHAKKAIMRVGFSTNMDHNYAVLIKNFKELAAKYSDNTVDVKLFCCGQLGTEDGAFKALQLGTVDGYMISSNNISPHFPLMDVFVQPYILRSIDHTKKVLGGPVGKEIFAKMAEKTKVHVLTYGILMTRDLFTTNDPVTSLADLKGKKIRVPKNQVMIKTFQAFGAEPTPIAWSETPAALQTGTVDGGDNGAATIKSMKFYEFAKNLTVLEHFIAFTPLLASDKFMAKLDDKQKMAVMRAAQEANDIAREQAIADTEEIRSFLESKGMTIYRPEKADFIKAAMTVQDYYINEKGEEFGDAIMKIRAVAE